MISALKIDEPFEILKMDTESDKDLIKETSKLHFNDFEVLVIAIEGRVREFIDFKSELLIAPFISFITKGKVHQFKRYENCELSYWLLRFKSELISETIFKIYKYYHNRAYILLKKGKSFNNIISICEILKFETEKNTTNYTIIINLLNALFYLIEEERDKINTQDKNIMITQNKTFINLLKMLEDNYHKPLGVKFYADKLFMSTRNLNLISNKILHQSITDLIESRRILEAKSLLISTDKTVAEIGFELGYKENTYFTSVFKKRTGETPTEFRNRIKKLIS